MPSRREFELFLTLRGALGSDFSNSMRRAQTEFKALRTAMSTVNNRMRDVSAYQRQSQAIRENEQRLRVLQERHREIQEAMQQTNAPSAELRRQLSRNEAQIQSLCDRMGEQRRELGQLDTSLRDAGVDTDNLTDATADLQRQYEDLGNCRRNLESINEALDINKAKFRDAVKEYRNMVGVAAGVGTAVYGAAVKPAMEYESAFTGVTKTVNGTEEELANLRQEMMNMSQADVIASAKDIAAVGEAAGQLGIHTENIADFSKAMIDLGESTNLSSTDAASSLAKFANITKMPQTEFSRLGSVIVDLGNNMATTEADIVAMGTRLASTGELVGLSEADIMGYAAALSSLGIEAEAGGTAASKMLKSMELAFSRGDMGDYAKTAGMTAEAFSKLYQNNKLGAISAFTKGLNDVERNGKTAIQILDEMEIREVRYSNAILALAASKDILTDATNIANKAWKENTALSTEAEKRYQTTESRVQLTKNAVENLGITLGDLATPYVKDLADDFTETAMRAQRFVRENGESIKEFAKGAVEVGGYLLALKGLKVGYYGVKGAVLPVGRAIETFSTACAKAKTMTGGLTFKNFIKSFADIKGIAATASGAIAGVTVAVAAVGLAFLKSKKDMEAGLKAFTDAALFNNGGKKLSELTDEFKSATAESKKFAEEIVATNEAHEENVSAIRKAKDEIYLYNDALNDANGVSAEAAEKLRKPFEDLSKAVKDDFKVSYESFFSAFSKSAKKAADDFGVDVGAISKILDEFNKKYNSAIDQASIRVDEAYAKEAKGIKLTPEEQAQLDKDVKFIMGSADLEGDVKAADLAQEAKNFKIDAGGNQEVAIQQINDFNKEIEDYKATITESFLTSKRQYEDFVSKNKDMYEHGDISKDVHDLYNKRYAEAFATVAVEYDEMKAYADEIKGQTYESIKAQINQAAHEAAVDSYENDFNLFATFENYFTNGGLFATSDDLIGTLEKHAKEGMSGIITANDEMRETVEKPIVLSVDVENAKAEMYKFKAERDRLAAGGSWVVTGTQLAGAGAGAAGYASGTSHAAAGLRLVGENGPELLQFRGGERVYNARETADILDGLPSAPSYSHYSGSSYNITVNPTFYGGANGNADEYGAQIAEEVIRKLDERERDARRNAYY